MKVLLNILFIALACSSKSPNKLKAKDTCNDLSEKSNETIEITLNKKYEICLPGNPTTGYSWNCSLPENKNVLKLKDSDYKQNDAPIGYAGVPGVYYFTFIGENKGTEKISCVYKRSWETSDSDKTEEVNVTVN